MLFARRSTLTVLALLFVFLAGLLPVSPAYAGEISVRGDRSLQAFMESLPVGNADQVVGVFVPGDLALRVVQQPAGNAAYVSNEAEVVTQFRMAQDYGVTGLLAHNTLSGELFFEVGEGELVVVVYGDLHTETYRVTSVRRFQALNPTSPYSNFVDLDQPGSKLSAADLFYQVYGQSGTVVMQTCITENGNDSWGRLFVIAEQVTIVRPVFWSTYTAN